MTEARFPPGWDEERVQRVIDHYENLSEDEEVAEDIRAVEASLRDMQNGETGRPSNEFVDEFRRSKNLPDDA